MFRGHVADCYDNAFVKCWLNATSSTRTDASVDDACHFEVRLAEKLAPASNGAAAVCIVEEQAAKRDVDVEVKQPSWLERVFGG